MSEFKKPYGVVIIKGDESYQIIMDSPDKVAAICYLVDWAENEELSLEWSDALDAIARLKHSDFVVKS